MSPPSPDLYPVTPEQMARLSADLVKVGDCLEAEQRPEWLAVARAAALLDGVRLGLVRVDAGGVHGCA